MKKNMMMRLASVLLIAVLMSTCAISGTFAKYVTSAEGSDSARVAKWDIQLSGNQMTKGHTMAFNLFNTVEDSTGGTETDIAANDGSIIAPGTKGSFEFTLENNSEVTASYVIDYTVTNTANIPVVFSLDGTTWKNSIDDLDVTTPVVMAIGEAATTVKVYWMWAFEGGNDDYDTDLGLKGTDVLTVAVKVTATQID